jgi:hypothetical protein
MGKKIGVYLGVICVITLVSLVVFWMFFVTFVDNYELGFSYNKFSGEIETFDRTGYFIRAPWHYSIHAIDQRPIQIQITANSGGTSSSSDINQRVLNAKLVQFDPKGLTTFVKWHGRSAGDDRSRLAEILRCYAFDRAEGRDCPFIKILGELAPSQAGDIVSNTEGGVAK